MKTPKFLLVLLVGLGIRGFAQTNSTAQSPFTVRGIFDTVFDHLGNKYALKNLQLGAPGGLKGNKTTGGGGGKGYSSAQVNALPSTSCAAGYFDLYFQNGSALAA